MHWHAMAQEPGSTPAYCGEHAPDDEMLGECWVEDHVCVVCEENEPA
jgi:hypothetical protein